jgi:hypothetical protein
MRLVNRDAEYSERSATWPNWGVMQTHKTFGGPLGSEDLVSAGPVVVHSEEAQR